MRSRPISIGPASSTRWRRSPPPAAGRASNPSEGSSKEQPDDPRDKRRPAHMMGAALLVYGPVSDRFGRKPIVVFGCALVIIASLGCIFARSLPQLLFFRALQGAGASGPGMAAVTIVSDLFDGPAARAKLSNVVFAINIVPMIAPTVGAALLAVGGWRAIYLVPIAGGSVLLGAMGGFSESARIDPNIRLSPAAIIRDYLRVLLNPLCVGYLLCNAAAAGAVFAYITGSSLFFIN